MSQPNRVQTSPNEGNILLAIHALQSGQISTVYLASRTYNVPKTTLRRRMKGGIARGDYTVKNTRLSAIEEEVIVKNIERLDAQGLSPSVTMVKDMADSICKARGVQPVGTSWPYLFISRKLATEAALLQS